MNNIPIYRGKRLDNAEYIEGKSIINDIHGNTHLINEIAFSFNWEMAVSVDPTTLAIKMPQRGFFMSLDPETGKGGDKTSSNEVLIWNGEMMNCSILKFDEDGNRVDYIIDLDNLDFDKISNVVGIKE